MFVVIRFRVEEADADEFAAPGARLRSTYCRSRRGSSRPGSGGMLDDPELLALTMEWENIGSYRRALSPYEVKLTAVPLLSRAIDEPTAYDNLTELPP